MDKTLRSLSTKSETAGAIRHALSQWRALARYLDDGLLKVDNSAAGKAMLKTIPSYCGSGMPVKLWAR
jgi:transposase